MHQAHPPCASPVAVPQWWQSFWQERPPNANLPNPQVPDSNSIGHCPPAHWGANGRPSAHVTLSGCLKDSRDAAAQTAPARRVTAALQRGPLIHLAVGGLAECGAPVSPLLAPRLPRDGVRRRPRLDRRVCLGVATAAAPRGAARRRGQARPARRTQRRRRARCVASAFGPPARACAASGGYQRRGEVALRGVEDNCVQRVCAVPWRGARDRAAAVDVTKGWGHTLARPCGRGAAGRLQPARGATDETCPVSLDGCGQMRPG